MGDDDEFVLDDDEDVNEEYAGVGDGPSKDTDEEKSDEEDSSSDGKKKKMDVSAYKGRVSNNELQMLLAYDDIMKCNGDLELATSKVLSANPKMTSAVVVSLTVADMFNKQGRNRVVNTKYMPDTMIDTDEDDDTNGLNKEYMSVMREHIANFIDYLANRDLSKDSANQKLRKLRHIPAFIIYLFSSGLYDLIIDCPTMPKEYADQIASVFKRIEQMKYDIVEELARKYEEAGRQAVADRVRKLQLRWFEREPADIRTISDLDITYNDIMIYREVRPKFTNISKSITQEVISDMIDVVIDKDAGLYKKLKDKTRTEAIIDVKAVFAEWCKENIPESDVMNKIFFQNK